MDKIENNAAIYPYNAILHMRDIFGKSYTLTGKVLGEVQRGFNLLSGAWSLYKGNDANAVPAVFIQFLQKGKRRVKIINNRDVEIEMI